MVGYKPWNFRLSNKLTVFIGMFQVQFIRETVHPDGSPYDNLDDDRFLRIHRICRLLLRSGNGGFCLCIFHIRMERRRETVISRTIYRNDAQSGRFIPSRTSDNDYKLIIQCDIFHISTLLPD